jgi:hypothetical protein
MDTAPDHTSLASGILNTGAAIAGIITPPCLKATRLPADSVNVEPDRNVV